MIPIFAKLAAPAAKAALKAFLGDNLKKIAIIAAVVAAVLLFRHEAYENGYQSGYADMEQLHNEEAEKLKKESDALILDVKERNEKEREKNESKLLEIIDEKHEAYSDLDAKYAAAVNRRMQCPAQKTDKSNRDRGEAKTQGAAVDDNRDQEGWGNGLDRESSEAILSPGWEMNRVAINCNAFLDIMSGHYEVVDDTRK